MWEDAMANVEEKNKVKIDITLCKNGCVNSQASYLKPSRRYQDTDSNYQKGGLTQCLKDPKISRQQYNKEYVISMQDTHV